MKFPSAKPYRFSLVIAGLVSVLGALTTLASLFLMLMVAAPANQIHAAIFQGAITRLLPLLVLGLLMLAFGLLCRAVFHIALIVRNRDSG